MQLWQKPDVMTKYFLTLKFSVSKSDSNWDGSDILSSVSLNGKRVLR